MEKSLVMRARRMVLILEDNSDRVLAFEDAVRRLGSDFRLMVWRDASKMICECGSYFDETCLISLDHDLEKVEGSAPDPGTGLDVAKFLAHHSGICPVIIHTSNHEQRWSMHNELRFAKWNVEIVGPIGPIWVLSSWLPKAKSLLAMRSERQA